MTLDRLIIELQKLQHEGHGSNTVQIIDEYTGQETGAFSIKNNDMTEEIIITMAGI